METITKPRNVAIRKREDMTVFMTINPQPESAESARCMDRLDPVRKIMKTPQDSEAVETVQTMDCPAFVQERLLRHFPMPWSFDAYDHPNPKWSDARVYAADSTMICNTRGEHARQVAELIVDAVNAYLQDSL